MVVVEVPQIPAFTDAIRLRRCSGGLVALVLLFCGLQEVRAQSPVATQQMPADVAKEGDGGSKAATETTTAIEFRVPKRDPLRDVLTWRTGFLASGLFDSSQGRPFFYGTIDPRYKDGDFYFDLHIPLLFGAFDASQYALLYGLFEASSSFTVFEGLNDVEQFMFLEFAHLRIGQSLPLGGSTDDEGQKDEEAETSANQRYFVTLGVVGMLEMVVFNAVLLGYISGSNPFDQDPFVQTPHDPFVVGPGAFVAFSGENDSLVYEVALEVSRDLVNGEGRDGESARGWAIGLDSELFFDLTETLAAFVRLRATMYTHLPERMVFTAISSGGVALRLW